LSISDCSLKGKTVRSIIPNGFIVAFTGAVIAGVSFELLSSLESGGVCWFLSGVLSCTDPIAIVRIVFYLAVAGSSLVILGAFQMGLWRNLIVRESSVLVITIGSSTLFLGFFMASVFPSPSGVSAGIAMFFGLLGAALLMNWNRQDRRWGERFRSNVSTHPEQCPPKRTQRIEHISDSNRSRGNCLPSLKLAYHL